MERIVALSEQSFAMRDLNDLNFFAAVVTFGGFSAAARVLGVPKSRISRRVSALEEKLGIRLIERSTRRLSVTEVGQDVYRHARAAIAEAEAIEEIAYRQKAEPQGLVRVSCPVGAERILSNRLPGFLRQYPRVRLQLIVTNRRVDLIEDGIDVAIRVRETFDTDVDLQMKVIGRTHARLVASPAYLDLEGGPASPSDLSRFHTLSHSERPGPTTWTLVDADGQEETILHEPRMAVNDHAILWQAAIEGVGIAFLPELICREAVAEGRLQWLLPEWTSREAVLHLVFTSRRGLLPGVRAFLDFAAVALDPLASSGRPVT